MNAQQKNNNSDDSEQKLKIKEFSEIIHTMRHDIRNFIAAIDGYAWLLKEEFNVDYVNRIISNIANITTVVDRSVALIDADLDIEKTSEIDLKDLVKSFSELLPESVELRINNLFKVKADYTRIQFLFKTVIENAIYHGEPKTIEVTALEPKNGYSIVQIVNDGKKIPEEKRKQLFTKMPQSLKPNGGLNLIVAKKIAQSHGWDLRYNDQIKDKTCFELLIPSTNIS